MQWFCFQNRFYGVFLISFSLSSETETPSCIPTQLSVVQKVEFSISFLILPLEGDITPHFSAGNTAGWLVSTHSRCQWRVKQVKKIKISMFHVNKNGFFLERKGKKRKWSERSRSRQSSHRKEEWVWKSWVWLITQITIFCEPQSACWFSHYLENMCRNKAVWIKRNSMRRFRCLLTGFTAAPKPFLNNNKKKKQHWVRDLANSREI